MPRQQGFTLVELVMVIVLLGIVATMSTQFVSLSVRGAIDLGDRQQRALQSVVISEQITRELREAHPLSVRAESQCIEWISALGATTYKNLPVEEASREVLISPLGESVADAIRDNPARFRLAVYGYSVSNFYDNSGDVAPISSPISALEDDGSVTDGKVSLASTHRFNTHSPQKRIYVLKGPVSICQNGDKLYRFENYGLMPSQPSFVDLNNSAGQSVMAANLIANSFRVNSRPISLQRSAVVNFEFILKAQNSEETTRVSQEVQIHNVP
ncbi:MAG: type II secretion system protein [Marinobacter sp.]